MYGGYGTCRNRMYGGYGTCRMVGMVHAVIGHEEEEEEEEEEDVWWVWYMP